MWLQDQEKIYILISWPNPVIQDCFLHAHAHLRTRKVNHDMVSPGTGQLLPGPVCTPVPCVYRQHTHLSVLCCLCLSVHCTEVLPVHAYSWSHCTGVRLVPLYGCTPGSTGHRRVSPGKNNCIYRQRNQAAQGTQHIQIKTKLHLRKDKFQYFKVKTLDLLLVILQLKIAIFVRTKPLGWPWWVTHWSRLGLGREMSS